MSFCELVEFSKFLPMSERFKILICPFLPTLTVAKNFSLAWISTYMEVYSLLTVNSSPVFDSEKVKETSSGVNDSNSESLATMSMWTFRNFSISLMLTPPLPIIDAIRSSFTITLTRFADKI